MRVAFVGVSFWLMWIVRSIINVDYNRFLSHDRCTGEMVLGAEHQEESIDGVVLDVDRRIFVEALLNPMLINERLRDTIRRYRQAMGH
jgi:hypothetical protein